MLDLKIMEMNNLFWQLIDDEDYNSRKKCPVVIIFLCFQHVSYNNRCLER